MMIAKAQRLHEEEQYDKDVTRMEQQTEVQFCPQPSQLQWSFLCSLLYTHTSVYIQLSSRRRSIVWLLHMHALKFLAHPVKILKL